MHSFEGSSYEKTVPLAITKCLSRFGQIFQKSETDISIFFNSFLDYNSTSSFEKGWGVYLEERLASYKEDFDKGFTDLPKAKDPRILSAMVFDFLERLKTPLVTSYIFLDFEESLKTEDGRDDFTYGRLS